MRAAEGLARADRLLEQLRRRAERDPEAEAWAGESTVKVGDRTERRLVVVLASRA